MAGLRDLYQEVILDHNRRPRNFRALEGATHHCAGHNPLCGDQVTLYLTVRDGRIEDIGFQGEGCAISTASASILTETLRGRTVAEADTLFDRFHCLLTDGDVPDTADVGKLEVLAGVRDYPTRVKCATLPWHALRSALRGEAGATTE